MTTSPVKNWTTSRYWSYIRSALRRAWMRFPNRYEALNAAKREKTKTGGRGRFEYKCAECSGVFPAKKVCVDHISPAGSLRNYNDLGNFVSNLFCPVNGLQVLCNDCHQEKTNAERGIIPEIAAFKKSSAAEQKAKLHKLKLPEGKNAKERIQIFEEYYESKS